MNKNVIEISSYKNIAYALIVFNICLVGICVVLTHVYPNSAFDLTSSQASETIR